MTEVFSETDYELAYPEGIERHFWHRARNDLLNRWLRARLSPGASVVDVGCGPGIAVAALREAGLEVSGVELGQASVVEGAREYVQTETSIFELDAARRDQIEAVLLLDVIEHIEQRVEFLQQIFEALPNCRVALLTVPARSELWSEYDDHYRHHLRYDRPTLRRELRQAGLRVKRCSYFFNWLYLVALAAKWLGLRGNTEFRAIPESGPFSLMHRLLGWVTRLESRLVPGFVVGSSIACLVMRDSE